MFVRVLMGGMAGRVEVGASVLAAEEAEEKEEPVLVMVETFGETWAGDEPGSCVT
jgi:hypothetical protein